LKLSAAVTTADTCPASAARVAADGDPVKPSSVDESESTELLSALVSVGKSLLAELITVLASFSILLKADFSALVPFAITFVLGSALTEFSRLVTDEQYDGLLLEPHPATSTAATSATSALTKASFRPADTALTSIMSLGASVRDARANVIT
jgi:hypothetical protein